MNGSGIYLWIFKYNNFKYLHQLLPNVMVERVTFLLRIRKVQISVLRPVNLTEVLWFTSVAPSKYREYTWNWTTIASFHILSSLSIACHPLNRRYIIWVTEKASLNKLHIKHNYSNSDMYYVLLKTNSDWICAERCSCLYLPCSERTALVPTHLCCIAYIHSCLQGDCVTVPR
jgi:hypothetical protein